MQTTKILDADSYPSRMKSNSWYVMRPNGYLPEARVGHTATYLAKERKVIFIGGANPNMVHRDTWCLDLSKLICKLLKTKGDFEYRYEHCAFVPDNIDPMGENSGTNICIFGGADLNGNNNDLWKLNVGSLEYTSMIQQGDVPPKRTLHAMVSVVKNKLTIFGGGAQGINAVEDTQVYQLNNESKMWTVKTTTGIPPEPRQGHAIIAVHDQLFIHGGMSGEKFYDDLHILSSDGLWSLAKVSENKPQSRAGHGAVLHGKYIYVLGGLGIDGVLNDFWRICTESLIWENIFVDDSSLPGRLDFVMFVADLPASFSSSKVAERSANEEEEVNSVEDYLKSTNSKALSCGQKPMEQGDSEKKQWLPFIIIHGGMDCGNVYDDFHAYKLE